MHLNSNKEVILTEGSNFEVLLWRKEMN